MEWPQHHHRHTPNTQFEAGDQKKMVRRHNLSMHSITTTNYVNTIPTIQDAGNSSSTDTISTDGETPVKPPHANGFTLGQED
uniref:Uncharacterized protein n=1 Tax=Ditylenchus dipsaci TaxID=166011 RepID=A0A915ENX5_9BILA